MTKKKDIPFFKALLYNLPKVSHLTSTPLTPFPHMAKHKPMCLVVSLLVIIGAVNWGLSGLGMLIGSNLNVVNLLLTQTLHLPVAVESIIYLLVGLAGLAFGGMYFGMKECSCEKK